MSRTFQNVSKEDFVNMMKLHQDQDKFMQGEYGGDLAGREDFKGCFMGCTVESITKINGSKLDYDDYEAQAEYLGLPEWLWILCEGIFEGLDKVDSEKFAIDLIESLPECETKKVDQLEGLIKIFIIESTKKYHNNKEIHAVVDQVVNAIKSDNCELLSAAESAAWSAESTARSAAWSAARSAESTARSAEESAAWSAESTARSAAWSAARSAESTARSAEESAAWSAGSTARSAAWSAAWSAESAARSAESTARSAAWSAAWSAESAARSAESTARSAAWSAAWSAEESAAWSAAESAAYKEIGDYLVQLLRTV